MRYMFLPLIIGLLACTENAAAQDIPNHALRFENRTAQLGVTVTHRQTTDEHITGLDELIGSGVCAFDANQDGWIDLFFVGGSGQIRYYGKNQWWEKAQGNRLYINQEGEKLIDMSSAYGLDDMLWGMACAWGDFDNDGWNDLIVSGIGAITFYKNNQGTEFSKQVSDLPLNKNDWFTSIVANDFDQDGDLDIYVTRFINYNKGAKTFEKTSGFSSAIKPVFDGSLYDAKANLLLENLGSFKFKDVARTAGVHNEEGRSLSALWFDANGDTFDDLLVINGFSSANRLYLNQGNKTFSPAPSQFRVESNMGNQGGAIADLDQDGDNDIVLSSPIGQPPLLLVQDNTPWTHIRSEPDGLRDYAWDTGIANDRMLALQGWAVIAADLNRDELVDVAIANGLAKPDQDAPSASKSQPLSLMLGTTEGRWVPHTNPLPIFSSGRGMALADINNDGLWDLVVSNNNEEPSILINTSPVLNGWIGFDIKDQPNQKVSVTLNTSLRTRSQTTRMRSTFLSQGDQRIIFPLKNNETILSVGVKWPDSDLISLKHVSDGKYWQLRKGQQPVASEHFSGTQSTEVKLKRFITDNRDNYVTYANMIARFAPDSPTALAVAQHQDEAVRSALISALASQKTRSSVALVNAALRDSSTLVQISAVSILKKWELEASVQWLLPLLEHESPDVACAVANAFEFFFHEEEAVVLRKYLAISPLVKMLASRDEQKMICALDALAEAERFRAVHPSIELLLNESFHVRARAARTLGLLRDRSAIQALIRRIEDEQENGAVVAHALIALKRLNEKNVDDFVMKSLTGDYSIERTSAIVATLLSSTDGTVFNRNEVLRQLEEKGVRGEEIKVIFDNADAKALERLPSKMTLTPLRQAIEIIKNKTQPIHQRESVFQEVKDRLGGEFIFAIARSADDALSLTATKALEKFSDNRPIRDWLWTLLKNDHAEAAQRMAAAQALIATDTDSVLAYMESP